MTHPQPKVTLYLSGPMTIDPDHPAKFAKWAAHYRDQGFSVLSPPEMDHNTEGPIMTYAQLMRKDVEIILEEDVTRMYMLPGFQKSPGCRLEKHLADMLDIAVYDVTTGELWTENVLQEADRIVDADRGDEYGHPFIDFSKTSGMINALFKAKLKSDFTPEDVSILMICVKLSRLANTMKRDSIVDIAGYAKTLDMVMTRRRELHGG